MKHGFLLIPALMFALLSQAVLADSTAPLWADLNDVVTYAPKSMLDAAIIMNAVKNKDARFTAGGAQFKGSFHLEDTPKPLPGGATLYRGAMLMLTAQNEPMFRKFEMEVGGIPRSLQSVASREPDTLVSNMHFKISAGLIDRMLVLESVESDVRIIYPLGVGGFDNNVMGFGKRLLTPLFHGARLVKDSIVPHRTHPSYYRGEPFMPITNAHGVQTAIGFHITILSDGDWAKKGPNYLVRGFDSHGCMRLRQRDLRELYAIVKYQKDASIPVEVNYFVWSDSFDQSENLNEHQVSQLHPYPFRTDGYMTVSSPLRRDPKEHLVVMNDHKGQPDLSGLRSFTADDSAGIAELNQLIAELNSERSLP